MKRVRGTNPREFDQFFTKPNVAVKCVGILEGVLKVKITEFDMVLEPSFGEYAFVNALICAGVDSEKLKFIDIDACDEGHRANFLVDTIVSTEYFHNASATEPPICLTIGNPPFGKASVSAVSFFNRAAEFSACIAFVVPRTFSKGSLHNKLDRHFFLIHEHILEKDVFLFKNETYKVPCVFQVWVHAKYAARIIRDESIQIAAENLRPVCRKLSTTPDFVFVKSNSNPDLAIRRVGVNAGMIYESDLDTRSEQSHYFILINDRNRKPEIIKRFKSLDLENTEVKFQTAGNPSISKTELCQLYLKNN